MGPSAGWAAAESTPASTITTVRPGTVHVWFRMFPSEGRLSPFKYFKQKLVQIAPEVLIAAKTRCKELQSRVARRAIRP